MISIPKWLAQAGIHQDLLWFAVLMGWSFAILIWWSTPHRRTQWGWLPWVGGAGVLTALLQFLVFNPPLDAFYERLVPGTHNHYDPARIDPHLFADIALAVVYTAFAALWWSLIPFGKGLRILRRVALPLSVGFILVHFHFPLSGGIAFSLLPLVTLPFLWKQTRVRFTLLLAAMLPLISPIGPLAFLAGKLQREGPTQWFGASCALFHWLVLTFIIGGLARDIFRSIHAKERRTFGQDIRPFLIGGALWVVAGTIFALSSGQAEVREIKTNRLRQTAARVPSLSSSLLDSVQKSVDGYLPTDQTVQLIPALSDALKATPFAQAARLLIKREDSLITLATVTISGETQTRQHRPWNPADDQAWNRAGPMIKTVPLPVDGAPYYCRAPITDQAGVMLGWLEFEWVEFYWTMERKWRTGPLLVTALGAILGGAFFVQRRHSREREEALRAAAIAAETARLKTSFLAKVSHELRTPLQSILGYGELLQSSVPDGPAQKQLAALRQHGQLMTRLVNDLIDLSALESGAFRLIEKPVNPTDLITQTIDSLRLSAENKHLALRLNIDPDLPLWIRADGERLREILINLTANAIKFTQTGSVDISVTRICDQPDEWLEIIVADTGPGIAPSDHDNIFQPFSRLSLTADQEGSGLGLTLVSGLCQSMRGTLTLESALGRGSRFRVRLPLHVCPAPIASLILSPDLLLHGKRVLVADDNSLIRELFINYLGKLGAECVIAKDGEEALRLAQNGTYEAMVLDLAMPKLSGFEVTRQLRNLGTCLRIIGVSAHTDAADRAEALAAGMDEFLTKPVELAALGQAISGPLVSSGTREMMESLRQGLCTQFRLNAPQQVVALSETYRRRDWVAMRPLIHHLRNSAIAINDEALQETCAQAESALIQGDEEKITATWTACTVALEVWLSPKPDAAAHAG